MESILHPISDYYAEKLESFGPTALGVDWNSEESQTLRFEQITKIIDPSSPFDLNDLGCGYAGLYDYLTLCGLHFRYFGYDISDQMIAAARQKHSSETNIQLCVSETPGKAKYTVASGIFNVRLTAPDTQWLNHILETLDAMNNASSHGFAFNILTSYSDQHLKKDHLYYGDPLFFFNWCKQHYSRNVALLHDYDLYEFTMLVRKENQAK